MTDTRGSSDDVPMVLGWMSRLVTSRRVAENLTFEVFGRLDDAQPAWLAGRPVLVRQRFHTTRAVLRLRGVL